MSVKYSIGSAPGHARESKPVSLDSAWPEPAISEKNFREKWPVAKLPK